MRLLFISLFILLYFLSGLSLTCYNKYILTAEHYGFTYPVTLILAHMTINCILSGSALRCCFTEIYYSPHSRFSPALITRHLFLTRFMPIGILFGLDITLTNVSFRFVSVSLTEVVKSAIPALIFLVNVAMGKEAVKKRRRSSKQANEESNSNCLYTSGIISIRSGKMLNVVLICTGVACTAAGEINFDIRGFLAAIGATIAATAKLQLVESLLGDDSTVPTSAPPSQQASKGLHIQDGNHGSSHSHSHIHILTSSSASPPAPAVVSPKLVHISPASKSHSHLNSDSILPSTLRPSESLASLTSLPPSPSAGPTAIVRRGTNGNTPRGSMAAALSNATAGSSNGNKKGYEKVVDESEDTNGTTSHHPSQSNRHHSHHHNHRLHPVLSLFYFTPVSALALLPFWIYFESSTLMHSKFVTHEFLPQTIALVVAGSFVAFGLNSSELFVIQETSALTLCFFGVMKFLLIIFISIAFFSYKLTPINQVGLVLAVAGLVVYNIVKWYELKEKEEMMKEEAEDRQNREQEEHQQTDEEDERQPKNGLQMNGHVKSMHSAGAESTVDESSSSSSASSSSSSSASSTASTETLLKSPHRSTRASHRSSPNSLAGSDEDISSRIIHAFDVVDRERQRNEDQSESTQQQLSHSVSYEENQAMLDEVEFSSEVEVHGK